MSVASFLIQLLNGLADASSMFLVAAGLSLIFGVTRIVNFAHGSFYMLGIYAAYTLVHLFGGSALGFWGASLCAAILVGAIGALVEILVLRRVYRAPELFQLLATFALVLIIRDVCLWIWGAEDLFAPRVPGLSGAVTLLEHRFPEYDLALIAIGPLVLLGLWAILYRTRWGTLLRAATQDREMVAALGVNQAWLFTGVFALGSFLAGLGGALQGPRMPANLSLDLETISTGFVVVVVGGMGSIPGAFLAALLIGEVKAICIALGEVSFWGFTFSFSRLTLVVEFVVMAIILVVRPWGLLGRPQAVVRAIPGSHRVLTVASPRWRVAIGALFVILLAEPLLAAAFPYLSVLLVEILVAVLFAASLHFIMGPGGMHSFGHAAYFGLGAYGAALLMKSLSLPMLVALGAAPFVAALGALVFGWFCVRLTGTYLAMLTLAFAQIVWSVVYQWDSVTGGSNGLIGIWPVAWLSSAGAYYYLTLLTTTACLVLMRRIVFSPFGFAMRAGRDSPLRAEAIGIDVKAIQWMAFIVAGLFCGMAGALFAFSKGSISPDLMSVNRSVDGLVMVLLGGIESLSGPIAGAAALTWLTDTVARNTEYWRAWLGVIILVLVIAFPGGIVGSLAALRELFRKWRTPGREASVSSRGDAGAMP